MDPATAIPVHNSNPPSASRAWAAGGLSPEMWRFTAGLRLVVAMLCMVLLFSGEAQLTWLAAGAILSYSLWAALVLWAKSHGRELGHPLLHCWIDAAWASLTLHTTSGVSSMLVITLVHPTVLASIAYGVRHGVMLAVCAAAAVFIDPANMLSNRPHVNMAHALPALGVLALVPAAAMLARTMNVMNKHRALVAKIEAQFDPRRGMEVMATQLVSTLSLETGAQLAGLVVPAALGMRVWLGSTQDNFSSPLDAQAQRRLDQIMAALPDCAVSHSATHGLGLLGGTRVYGPHPSTPALTQSLQELAGLLQMNSVIVMPMTRYERRHGYLFLGYDAYRIHTEQADSLAQAAPELLRLVETATLVDRLQEETAAHERARIGRDLHDSAIQPYLGLKYAVESVALGLPADNPARADLDALSELVNAEINTLREVIGGMRNGEPHGDNALVPAVKRQAKHFAQLFGIEVHVNAPAQLRTSRALAGALFHMINEALNNVRKHTSARQVWLQFEQVRGDIQLKVRDNAGHLRRHPIPLFRPRSLSERAAELGGHLIVTYPDGLNTELLITIPLKQEAHLS